VEGRLNASLCWSLRNERLFVLINTSLLGNQCMIARYHTERHTLTSTQNMTSGNGPSSVWIYEICLRMQHVYLLLLGRLWQVFGKSNTFERPCCLVSRKLVADKLRGCRGNTPYWSQGPILETTKSTEVWWTEEGVEEKESKVCFWKFFKGGHETSLKRTKRSASIRTLIIRTI